MCPIALYNQAKIGQILRAVSKKKQKKPLKIGHLIPFNPGLIFFLHESNLAQTIRPIVLYNHAKNWKVH